MANFLGRLKELRKKSGVVAINLIDEGEGRISMIEAMVRMIEDLVSINQRLLERSKSPIQDDDTLAKAIADALAEDD